MLTLLGEAGVGLSTGAKTPTGRERIRACDAEAQSILPRGKDGEKVRPGIAQSVPAALADLRDSKK
jgi:hypothetical protein